MKKRAISINQRKSSVIGTISQKSLKMFGKTVVDYCIERGTLPNPCKVVKA